MDTDRRNPAFRSPFALKSSRRELASLRVARIELQFGRNGRNIHNQPVPKPAAGRSVRVIARLRRSRYRRYAYGFIDFREESPFMTGIVMV